MATITTRSGKGSPLTNTEVDDNFTNLNTAKYESGDNVSLGSGSFSSSLTLGSNPSNAGVLQINDTSTTGYYLRLKGTGTRGYQFQGSSSGGQYHLSFANENAPGGFFITTYGGATFNEGAIDHDFRVESTSSTHALFVDAGESRVGVNKASPLFDLHVNGTTYSTHLHTSTTSNFNIGFNSGGGNVYIGNLQHNGGSDGYLHFVLNSSIDHGQGVPGQLDIVVKQRFGNIQGYVTRRGRFQNNNDCRLKIYSIQGSTSKEVWLEVDDYLQGMVSMTYKAGGNWQNSQTAPTSTTDTLLWNSDDYIVLHQDVYHTVVNESGSDIHDFRVESDTNANMLFVDAGSSEVGIGTGSPEKTLDIAGSIQVRNHASISHPRMFYYNGDDTAYDSGGAVQHCVYHKYAASPGNQVWQKIAELPVSSGVTGEKLRLKTTISQIGTDDHLTFECVMGQRNGFAGTVYNAQGTSETYHGSAGVRVYTQTDGTADVYLWHDSGQYLYLGITIEAYADGFAATAELVNPSDISSVNSTPSGTLVFDTTNDTYFKPKIITYENGVAINETSQDYDFRVESDANSAMLYVDGGNNRVGIGVGAPELTLDVGGSAQINGYIIKDAGSNRTNAAWSSGDWITIATIPYGELNGVVGIDWHGVAIPGTAHHGYARVKVGSYYNSYYYGWETRLQLLDQQHHNSFYFSEFRVVRADGYSTGDALLLQARSATNVTGGTFKTYVERAYGPGGTSISPSTPTVDNSPNGNTVQAIIYTPKNSISFSGEMNLTQGAVINQGGYNTGGDFRVETANNTHALLVDSSSDAVMVGGSSDFGHTLNVNGTACIQTSTQKSIFRVQNQATTGERQTWMMLVEDDSTDNSGSASDAMVYLNSARPTTSQGSILKCVGNGNSKEFFNVRDSGKVTVNNSSHTTGDFQVKSSSKDSAFYVDADGAGVTIGAFPSWNGGNSDYGVFFESIGTGAQTILSTNSSNQNINFAKASGYTNGNYIAFHNAGSSAGSIGLVSGGTGIQYNTTSDRRLKENIEAITDGTEKLMAMNPVTHTWIAHPDAPAVHGFIAQEMKEIVPEAVSGEDGGEEMMAMDYGRITPVLVAALQDAHKKIAELETRLTELEGK